MPVDSTPTHSILFMPSVPAIMIKSVIAAMCFSAPLAFILCCGLCNMLM